MLDVIAPPPHLNPREASVYLLNRHGVVVADRTLAKYRWTGGGPLFFKHGERRVLYRPADLDAWVKERLGDPRTSTAA